MDAVPGQGREPSFRLIYRSRNRIPAEQRRTEVGELFSVARSNNKKQHISGALLVAGDWFVQTLEGDEDAVRSLYAHIERDPRHDSIELLDTQLVATRVFERWAMARVGADGEPDVNLIARTDGIAAAASRGGTTPEQEQVLDVMRVATRVDAGHG